MIYGKQHCISGWGGGVTPARLQMRVNTGTRAAMTTAQWGQQVWLTAKGQEHAQLLREHRQICRKKNNVSTDTSCEVTTWCTLISMSLCNFTCLPGCNVLNANPFISAYKLPTGLNFLQDTQEFNADLRQSPTHYTYERFTKTYS